MDLGIMNVNNNNYVSFRNDLRNSLFYLVGMLYILIKVFLYSNSYLIGMFICGYVTALYIHFLSEVFYRSNPYMVQRTLQRIDELSAIIRRILIAFMTHDATRA